MTDFVPSTVRTVAKADDSRYRRRIASLTTKHAKECALAWPLSRGLGLSLLVPISIDTDALGTFTGEIPREGAPGEVARRKARLGMEATRLPLGLASEGSFGPHPLMPFLPSDFELLVFLDDEEGFTVSEQIVTSETNYAQARCVDPPAALAFAAQAHFPSHSLIVRPAACPDPALIRKDVRHYAALLLAVRQAIEESPEKCALLETDMRAYANPTRMRLIRRLGARLARRLRTHCPACHCPGFGKVGAEPGLPCVNCGEPTEMTLWEIFGCPRCGTTRRYPRADGSIAAQAQYCPACNP